jgi:hypothetical protein
MDCYACHNNDQFDQLPPRERIAADPHWRVAHVVPRMPDIPADRRGPAVFGYLIRPPGQGIDEQHRDELAAALKAQLNRAGS